MHMPSTRSGKVLAVCAASLFTAVICLQFYGNIQSVQPRFVSGSYQSADGAPVPMQLPFLFNGAPPSLSMHLQFDVPTMNVVRYHARFLGCIENFRINSRVFSSQPLCDAGNGQSFDAGTMFHTGRNDLYFTLRNDVSEPVLQAFLALSVSPRDPWVAVPLLAILFTMAAYGCFVVAVFFRRRSGGFWLSMIVVAGALLRILYVAVTPVAVRAYDVIGHLEYIRYAATHAGLPSPELGIQMYQPPLYYFLCAVWFRIGSLLSRSTDLLFADLQLLSVALAVLTLILGILIGRRLFRDMASVTLFAGILATFPALVFLSSRLNNDALLQLTAFGFFLALLRWYGNPGLRGAALLGAITGIGLLTKTNALLFVPVFVLCVPAVTRSWRKAVTQCAAFFLPVLALAGWLLWLRFAVQHQTSVVGNEQMFLADFSVPTSWRDFVFFNPFDLITSPTVAGHPGRLWEYVFRSSYFMVGVRSPVVSLFVIALLLVLALAIAGIVRDWREKAAYRLPVLLMLLVPLAGIAALRFSYPVVYAQDFRYVIMIVPSLAYFAVRGALWSKGLSRDAAVAVILSLIGLGAFLPVLLSLS